jgi:hypothetical protein
LSQIYRIEVPARARDGDGSLEGLTRFVVMVEIPDHAISELGNPGSPELKLKALGIAMNATWNQLVKNRNLQFPSWFSSVVVDAEPADYGEATFKEADGCRAWIVEPPFSARPLRLSVR